MYPSPLRGWAGASAQHGEAKLECPIPFCPQSRHHHSANWKPVPYHLPPPSLACLPFPSPAYLPPPFTESPSSSPSSLPALPSPHLDLLPTSQNHSLNQSKSYLFQLVHTPPPALTIPESVSGRPARFDVCEHLSAAFPQQTADCPALRGWRSTCPPHSGVSHCPPLPGPSSSWSPLLLFALCRLVSA